MKLIVESHTDTVQALGVNRADQFDQYTCNCPRYQEIKDFLIANRAHDLLAIDSMEFALAEPNMLRYLENLNFNVTPAEFRAFLHCCNVKNELFLYKPFPGIGRSPFPLRNLPLPSHTN